MIIRHIKEDIVPVDWMIEINRDATKKAMKKLKGFAFKLYIYLITYPEIEFAATAKEIAEEFGIDKKDLIIAMNELEENNYLYDAGNKYYFFDKPRVVLEPPKSDEELEISPW